MSNIAKIDGNFEVRTMGDGCVLRYFSISDSGFDLRGLEYANGKFRRMPEAIAQQVSAVCMPCTPLRWEDGSAFPPISAFTPWQRR